MRTSRNACAFLLVVASSMAVASPVCPTGVNGETVTPIIFTKQQIEQARAELFEMQQDIDLVVSTLADSAVQRLSVKHPREAGALAAAVERARKQLQEAQTLYDLMPEQALPHVASHSRMSRGLLNELKMAVGINPFNLSSSPQSITSSAGSPVCAVTAVTDCIDFCGIAKLIAKAFQKSAPDAVVTGSCPGATVNFPSPVKFGAAFAQSIIEIICDTTRCLLEEFLFTCPAATADILNDELNFTDDRELEALKQSLVAALNSGKQEVIDEVNQNEAKLDQEQRYADDSELSDHESNVRGAMNGLRAVTCSIEDQLRKRDGKVSPACVESTSASVQSPGRRQRQAAPAHQSQSPSAATPGQRSPSSSDDLQAILLLEQEILDGSPVRLLSLSSDRGGTIDEVRNLVWKTIHAQEDLRFAPEETAAGIALATTGDAFFESGDYAAAYREYRRAYKALIPIR